MANAKPEPKSGQSKDTARATLLLTVIQCIVLFGLVGGGIFAYWWINLRPVKAIPVGVAFIDAVGAHNYEAAKKYLAPGMQESMPTFMIEKLELNAEKYNGSYVGVVVPPSSIPEDNGQPTMSIQFSVQFSQSTRLMTITFEKNLGSYVITGYSAAK